MICDEYRAFRAEFNQGVVTGFPKAKVIVVVCEDFENLKKAQVVDGMSIRHGFFKDTKKILTEKLDRRNTYADPSQVAASPLKADEMIVDPVPNVIGTELIERAMRAHNWN